MKKGMKVGTKDERKKVIKKEETKGRKRKRANE